MEIEKLFLNPKTMDIEDLLLDISNLHKHFSKYFNVDNARMKSEIQKNYINLIKDENLLNEGSNVEEIFKKLAFYSQGMLKWNHPGAMININPPAIFASVAAASYVSMYNGNAAQDMSCGYLLTTELIVIKMICDLVGLNHEKSGGIFTFGGKSTNLHALKHGIQRVAPNSIDEGIEKDIICFTSTQGHPCHTEVAGWLGIGQNNCIKVETDRLGRMDLSDLEQKMDKELSEGKKVALITANGGTTIQMTIDPIRKIVELRDRLVEKYKLNYKPRVHVDSVIGWVYLFFKTYDFEKNPYNLSAGAIIKLKKQLKFISELCYADSFGVDFHKTGFCSYLSSLYITKDMGELYAQGKVKPIPYNELEYGNYSPFQYSLELSRSLNGPVEAYVNLKLLGYQGYQELIANLYNTGEKIKELFSKNNRFEVINNEDSFGFTTLFIVKVKEEDPSFFDFGEMELGNIKEIAKYNHKFYLYLLEQQKIGKCWFSIDYSSGYHKLSNGMKIGVLKIYQMSPYFKLEEAEKFVEDLGQMLQDFDLIKDSFEVKEVPHKPRDFVFR